MFQSTLPVGGATRPSVATPAALPVSIHAPRGGSDDLGQPQVFSQGVSIHAPRGGSDAMIRFPLWDDFVSIHAPRGGSDISVISRQALIDSVSIHAPRGGSDHSGNQPKLPGNRFNPRSPWGERLFVPNRLTWVHWFQSTLPVGGATAPRRGNVLIILVSIHAPRGGSDSYQFQGGGTS